jgi:hypothetical protein
MKTGLTVASERAAIEKLAINTIRTLCMDAVQAANSGHPGSQVEYARTSGRWNRVRWSERLESGAAMSWIQRYRLRQFVRTSLLLFPTVCLMAAVLLAPVLRWLDHRMAWRAFDFSPDGARAVLGAFTGSMLTFIVFVLSSLVVVLQLASGQFSPGSSPRCCPAGRSRSSSVSLRSPTSPPSRP